MEKFRFKREGGYFGLVVIQKLDAFVDECLEAAHDNGRDEFGAPSDRNSGNCEPIVGTPKLEFEIKDINWKAIPHDLTYDIINLNIDADQLENEVYRFSENDPSHDYSDTMTMRQRGYADLGLRAYGIANRLRKEIKRKRPATPSPPGSPNSVFVSTPNDVDTNTLQFLLNSASAYACPAVGQ